MLSAERARELFRYDPITGKLYWRKKPTPRANRIKAGDEVGNIYHPPSAKTAYRQCAVDKQKYLVHRIIWLLHYGQFPTAEIDHEDGNGLNNRIRNLRDVLGAEQRLNHPKRTDNSSGHCGVSRHSKAPKWVAQIQWRGKNHYLGLFDSIEEAVQARQQAAEKFGFHKNHGR